MVTVTAPKGFDAKRTVTREQVIWAYRLFLDREPESDAVVERILRAVNSTAELRNGFLTSAEFLSRNMGILPSAAGTTVIKELAGFRLFLDLSDFDVGLNVIKEVYEPDEQAFVRQTVKQGEVAVDVGANIGLFSMLLAAQVGPTGHVYAFEPLARNACLLSRSIAENRFDDRISLAQVAVGAESGEVDLISLAMTTNWGGSYLRINEAAIPAGHDVTRVSIVTLDEKCIRRPISFIKIDAEGAELLVLRGAKSILEDDHPTVLTELNSKQLATVSRCSTAEIINEMRHYGYRCHVLCKGELGRCLDSWDTPDLQNVVFIP